LTRDDATTPIFSGDRLADIGNGGITGFYYVFRNTTNRAVKRDRYGRPPANSPFALRIQRVHNKIKENDTPIGENCKVELKMNKTL
jgi:hypothetical protein